MEIKTKEDYMKSLSWDMDKYALLTKDEVAPLLDKKGNEMYTYSIKDPKGVKAFGKGAKVVNIEWAEGLIPGITSGGLQAETEEEASAAIPPPPPKKKPVPEDIQKVADASDNVVIASVPKHEEKQEKEYPGFVHTRANNLVQNHGFKFNNGLFVRGDEKYSYDELETMGNDDWKAIITYKPEPEEEEDIAQIREELQDNEDSNKAKPEVIKEQQEKQAEARKEVVEKAKVEKDQEFLEDINKPVKKDAELEEQADHEDLEGDLKGEVVDATTIRTEVPKSNVQKIHRGTKEEHDEAMADEYAKMHKAKEASKSSSEMTSGNIGGFFSTLSKLGFQQLNLSVTRLDNGKLNVIVKPENFSGDPAYDEIKPLNISGTPEEMDNGFMEAVAQPLEVVAGMMSNAKSFLDDLKEKEKKTKAAEEKKKKVEKLVEKAKKYHDDKDFDPSKTVSFNTATKKWNDVLELDPENKDAQEGIQKLKDYKAKNGETLNLE